MSWDLLHNLGDIMRGAALAGYERDLRQQTAELNDLFLLLCFMEAAALPNPAAWHPGATSAAYRRHVAAIERRMIRAAFLLKQI